LFSLVPLKCGSIAAADPLRKPERSPLRRRQPQIPAKAAQNTRHEGAPAQDRTGGNGRTGGDSPGWCWCSPRFPLPTSKPVFSKRVGKLESTQLSAPLRAKAIGEKKRNKREKGGKGRKNGERDRKGKNKNKGGQAKK